MKTIHTPKFLLFSLALFILNTSLFANATPTVDVGMSNLVSPSASNNGCFSSSESVRSYLVNFSSTPIDFAVENVTVTAVVSGAINTTLTQTVTSGTLAAGTSTLITFDTPIDMTSTGEYQFEFTAASPNDSNAANDTYFYPQSFQSSIVQTGASPTDYAADFLDGNLPAGWNKGDWSLGGISEAGDFGYLNNNLFASHNSANFNTTKIYVSQATDVLSFEYRLINEVDFPNVATPTGWGTMQIQAFTCGQAATTFYTIDDSNHSPSTDWATAEIDISQFVGQEVFFRFLIIRNNPTAPDYYVHVGNFFLGTPPTCATPSNISALAISGNVVKLSWDVLAEAERYRIRYRETGGSWAELLTASTETFRFINNLTPNTTYEYQVKSLCDASNSVWSATATVTTPNTICDFPTGTDVLNITSTSAQPNWLAYPDDIKYKFKYKAVSGGAWIETLTSATTIVLTTLNASTEYKYKLKSKCPSGWTNWSGNYTFITGSSFANRLSSNEQIAAIKIYPNPSSKWITVDVADQNIDQLIIKNSANQTVKVLNKLSSNVQIDIEGLGSGIYFISCFTNNGLVRTERFVKL